MQLHDPLHAIRHTHNLSPADAQHLWPESEGIALDQLGHTVAVRDNTSRQSLAADEQVYDMRYQTASVKLGGGSTRLGPQQYQVYDHGVNAEITRTRQ